MSTKSEEAIFQAIENGTYKSALQQCAKLIKKAPNVTFYHVLNNYVLLESGKVEESVNLSLELMKKTPNDLKSLELLNALFNKAGRPIEAVQVFENAAKKYPSFDIITRWFHLGCEESDPRILQKSSMALKIFHPTQRLFNSWAAFSYYLCAIADDASNIEKNLFPKLGLKIIESLEPFRSEQEVYVMVQLLQLNNQLGNIPKIITEFTGDNKLDLELQIILLKTLNDSQDYENLFKWSNIVLNDYKMDDFNTWKYLIKSGVKLKKDVLSILNSYGDTRNSLLGKVEYALVTKQDLLESIKQYIVKFGSKKVAFFDLKPYISQINSQIFLTWLESQPLPSLESKALVWELNILKFQLFFDKSILDSPDFINSNIERYNKYKHLLSKKSKTDFFDGDEFILLLIQSLLKKNLTTSTIVKSIVILESLVKQDEHEFHLRLWLVQLYTLINANSQAAYHYESLKIKNIQLDILDHYRLSRSGSIMPNESLLRTSFENYEKMEFESIYFSKIGFNKNVLNKLKSIIEMTQNFKFSYLKRHEILQGLILSRIFNDKSLNNYYKNALNEFEINFMKSNSTIKDNRDFDIFWDFGIGEDFGLSSNIFQNIPPKGSNVDDILILREKFPNEDYKDLLDLTPEQLKDLTNAERWSIKLFAACRKLFKDDIGISEIKQLYEVDLPKIPNEPSWEIPHTIITYIDISKNIQSYITKHPKKLKARNILELKELNLSLLQSVREDKVLEAKEHVDKSLRFIKAILKQDEDLKKLEINSSLIDRILDIISQSNNETFKLLRIF